MKPLHPGEVLLEEFLKPVGITPYRLAKDIGVPTNCVTGIVNEERSITADTALRFGRYFGTSAKVWTALQADCDLTIAESLNKKAIRKIAPVEYHQDA